MAVIKSSTKSTNSVPKGASVIGTKGGISFFVGGSSSAPKSTVSSTPSAPKPSSSSSSSKGSSLPYETGSLAGDLAKAAALTAQSKTSSMTAPKIPGAPAPVTAPVGVKAMAPTVQAPKNTLPTSQMAPAPKTTTTTQGLYTPPNQGLTGVSQGGIIGNIVKQGSGASSAYTNAINEYNQVASERQKLEDEFAKQNKEVLSRPQGLTQQAGQQGLLQSLYNQRKAALEDRLQAVSNVISAANTQQQLQQSAMTSAGQLNAPQFVSPGQAMISPSYPIPGATTSGAMNLGSLIGKRPSAANPAVTEYFNTQTGQGFSSPQELADFINAQFPGTGATAQNVFQVADNLSKQAGGGSQPIVGLPPQTMQLYAQMLATGQGGSIPSSVTGNTALMAQLYGMANQMAGGNLNLNQLQTNVSTSQDIYSRARQELQPMQNYISNFKSLAGSFLNNMKNSLTSKTAVIPLNTKINQLQGLFTGQGFQALQAQMQQVKQAAEGAFASINQAPPTEVIARTNQLFNLDFTVGELGAIFSKLDQELVNLYNGRLQQGAAAYGQISNPYNIRY